jgi:hypothetical protein
MPDYLAREESVEAVFCNRVLHGHQRLHRARIGHLQDSFRASNVDLPVGQSTCRKTLNQDAQRGRPGAGRDP